MSSRDIIKTAEKFMKKHATEINEKFQKERERLNDFYYDIYERINSIINEMGGDIESLRFQNFPDRELNEVIKIYRELVDLKKSITSKNVYGSAERIFNHILNRHFKARVDTLEVIINHFLKNNEITPKSPIGRLKPLEVHSLSQLIPFAHGLKKYIEANPLLDKPQTISMFPMRPEVISDPEFREIGPEAKTNPGRK